MKRGWIGFALLLLLLAGGAASSWTLVKQQEPMEGYMEQAAGYALAADWENAEALTQWVRGQWQLHRKFTAAFADHGPMEEIDGLFAQLEVYRTAGETIPYAAVCAELSCQLRAMGEAHIPSWWNLL